jgi:hypothetical protein
MININYNEFLISEICDNTFSNHVIKKSFHEKLLVTKWFGKEVVKEFSEHVIRKGGRKKF